MAVDLPVVRVTREGERLETLIYQIGVGGCLIAWDESIRKGEQFRMEVQLPNLNWLPLYCKALYCFEGDAIGIQFEDISQFEQDLLVEILSNKFTSEGIPFDFDPYSTPKTFVDSEKEPDHEGVPV